MNKRKKALLDNWAEHVKAIGRGKRTSNAVRGLVGLGDQLLYEGGSLAWVNAEETWNDKLSKYEHSQQLVTFELPGFGTFRTTSYLIQKFDQLGVPWVILPRGTRQAAGLITRTIEVIDHDKGGFLLEPSTLIKADVQEPFYYESRISYKRIKGDIRTSFYISGFDANDGGYFLCELPQGSSPSNLAEAYRCLEPEAVRLAREMGRKVRRQGDIFAIQLKTDVKKDLDISMKTKAAGYVLNTNHFAGEMLAFGGAVYARGKLSHRPRNRRPDHAPLLLGRKWHLLVKNTVPVVVRRRW